MMKFEELTIAEIKQRYIDYCKLNNYWISQQGERVKPDTAAILLGVTVETLRNWRSQKGAEFLPYSKLNRITYYLDDLAKFEYERRLIKTM